MIGSIVGRNLASYTAELGGKAPIIVFGESNFFSFNTILTKGFAANVDLDIAVNGVAFASYIASGQVRSLPCLPSTPLSPLTDLRRWYPHNCPRHDLRIFPLGPDRQNRQHHLPHRFPLQQRLDDGSHHQCSAARDRRGSCGVCAGGRGDDLLWWSEDGGRVGVGWDGPFAGVCGFLLRVMPR